MEKREKKESYAESDNESGDERQLKYQLREAQKKFSKFISGKANGKITPEERRAYALQVSGELARIHGELAEIEESEGELVRAGQNLEREGFYLATVADYIEENDAMASARYRSASIKALQQAERYAGETEHYEVARKIKEQKRKQISKLEEIAGELEKARRRIAAVILCGVLSLVFSVGKITGYVSGNAVTTSSAVGVIFFVVGCVFLGLLLRQKQTSYNSRQK